MIARRLHIGGSTTNNHQPPTRLLSLDQALVVDVELKYHTIEESNFVMVPYRRWCQTGIDTVLLIDHTFIVKK